MASSERGRPPERSGGEYLTPREAAGILGVTEATVRNMIRRGELDGRQWHTNPGEPRYQATTESVERKAVESKRPPVVRDIDRRTEQVLETLSENFKWIGAEVAQNREMITGAVVGQEKELKKRLDTLNEGLDKALVGMDEMRQLAAEQAEREHEYQRESLDIQRENAKAQRETAEGLARALDLVGHVEWKEREAEHQDEHRSFWRRLIEG